MSFLLIMLMTLWTPPFSDDWHYGFIFEKEGPLVQRPIQTLSDVIESVHNQYLYKDNGRCTPHFFVILFDGILGHKAFAVCNGLMFALMLHLFCLNFAGRKENYFTVASIVMASIVILLPEFSSAMLWMSGACNYLWDAVFVLFFHYLLGKDIRKRWWGLLFLYGIIAGNTHEGIMIGLSVGYAVYYLSHFKELTAQRWVMLIGLAIGVAFLVFSPAAMNRTTVAGTTVGTTTIFTEGPKFLIKHFPTYFFTLRITYIAVFLMIYRKKFPLLWGSAMIPLALLCMLVQCSSDTTYFGLELCSLAVVLQLLDIEQMKKKYVVGLFCLPIIIMIASLPLCADNYLTFLQIDKGIKYSSEKNTIVYANAKFGSVPFISKRFILPSFWASSLQLCPFLCKYYDRKDVCIVPTSLRDDLASGNVDKEFNLHTPYPYYVCEWDGSDDVVGKMTYYPSPYANYPLLNRMGRFTINEQDIQEWHYIVIPFKGKRYLVIEKNTMLDDRIKSIEVRSKE